MNHDLRRKEKFCNSQIAIHKVLKKLAHSECTQNGVMIISIMDYNLLIVYIILWKWIIIDVYKSILRYHSSRFSLAGSWYQSINILEKYDIREWKINHEAYKLIIHLSIMK